MVGLIKTLQSLLCLCFKSYEIHKYASRIKQDKIKLARNFDSYFYILDDRKLF